MSLYLSEETLKAVGPFYDYVVSMAGPGSRLIPESRDPTSGSNLEAWEQMWCMSFNLDKCNIMTVTRKRNKIIHKYHLHEHELERVNSTTYLGVELSENLTWNRHIAKTCNKATKTLSFLRRNLRVRNVQAKSLAYKGLVRPSLAYCCSVWDPHHKNQDYQLEIVQRRAARFVLSDDITTQVL